MHDIMSPPILKENGIGINQEHKSNLMFNHKKAKELHFIV